MDLITHDVRSKHWGEIIAQCQAKPEGISTKQWLRENGIKEKAYYYQLRKFRKQAYEMIQTDNSTDCTAPVCLLQTKNVENCRPKMQVVARWKCRSLQLHFVGYCKPPYIQGKGCACYVGSSRVRYKTIHCGHTHYSLSFKCCAINTKRRKGV